MSFRVSIPQFEGAIDLLVYLVIKSEIDIFDIDISKLCNQYQQAIDLMQEIDLDIAGDFLTMASRLMVIKARTLVWLQQKEAVADLGQEIEEDPREELREMIMRHLQIQEAAGNLAARSMLDRDQFRRGGAGKELRTYAEDQEEVIEATVIDLMKAMSRVISRVGFDEFYEVTVEHLSIMDRMLELIDELVGVESLVFEDLICAEDSKLAVVCTFCAILEMIRLKLIYATQAGHDAPIRLVRSVDPETLRDYSFEDVSFDEPGKPENDN